MIGSDSGLFPNSHYTITWNNPDLLPSEQLGINDSLIWINIQIFALRNVFECHLQNSGHFVQKPTHVAKFICFRFCMAVPFERR